ncbi:MAG: hypothetical protein ABGY42_03360, partial [bacterium]
MIEALFVAIALAPLFWLLVPFRWRKDGLALVSLMALGFYDIRLPAVALGLIALLFATTRLMARIER